jgi:hypothetical protein
MRRVVLALPLAAALAVGTAPMVFADSPRPVDFVLTGDAATVCAGEVARDVGSLTVRIERTATDIQFSDGATVRLNATWQNPAEEFGEISLGTPGSGEIALPADWTSQPAETLSEGVEMFVTLAGVQPGLVPTTPITWIVEEAGTEPPEFQEFEGSVSPFEVLDCAPTPTAPPAPVPTIAPTDAASAAAGGNDPSGAALVLFALSGIAVTVAFARRRLEDESDNNR